MTLFLAGLNHLKPLQVRDHCFQFLKCEGVGVGVSKEGLNRLCDLLQPFLARRRMGFWLLIWSTKCFFFSLSFVKYIHIFVDMKNLFFFSVTDVTPSWASAGPNCVIWRLCHSPMLSMIVIELADKLYNSVTVCYCSSPWTFIQINNFSRLPALGIEPLTHGLQNQHSTSTPWGTHFIKNLTQVLKSYYTVQCSAVQGDVNQDGVYRSKRDHGFLYYIAHYVCIYCNRLLLFQLVWRVKNCWIE